MSGVRVLSIKRCEPETVYDLTVDEHHEFFANGILVHNSVVVGMGLLYVLPGALPEGDLGPKTVSRPPETNHKPLGQVPTRRQREEPATAAMRQWNVFGLGSRGGDSSDNPWG